MTLRSGERGRIAPAALRQNVHTALTLWGTIGSLAHLALACTF